MQDPQDLITLFDGDAMFAWRVLFSEIKLHSETSIQTQHIKNLIQLYSKGMEKLNLTQNSSINYFKSKINELIGEKKVIQCLNQQRKSDKKSKKTVKIQNDSNKKQDQQKIEKICLDRELQNRKREMEIRLAYDIQTKTGILNSIIDQQNAKQKKIKNLIEGSMINEQQKLKKKIAQRQLRILSSKNIFEQKQPIIELPCFQSTNIPLEKQQFAMADNKQVKPSQ